MALNEVSSGKCSAITRAFRVWRRSAAAAVFLVPLLLGPTSPARAEEKPSVLLLPFQIFAPEEQHAFLNQGLRSMFISRLTGEGLEVVSDKITSQVLTEADRKGVATEERAEELGLRAQAEYAIFGSVTAVGGAYSLDLGILDLKKNPPKLTRVSEATAEDRLIPRLADVAYQFRAIIEGIDYRQNRMMVSSGGLPEAEGTMGLFFSPSTEAYGFKPSGHVNLRASVVSMDTGDLDGDGQFEVVLVSREKLMVASREDDSMTLKDRLDVRVGEAFVRVSVGDMNRDGKDEIYLVSEYGKRAQTNVYAWQGSFRKISEHSGHLNLVRDERVGKEFLLHQDSKVGRVFSGDISFMEYDDSGSLRPKGVFPAEDAQIHTLAVADLNRDGHFDFLGLGKRNRLHLWSIDGTVLWKGDKKLGGSNNVMESGERRGPDEAAPVVEVNGRVMVADIDRDGTREVIAAQNIAVFGVLERIHVYKTSRLYGYRVEEGSTLSQNWLTREIQYAVSDLQVEGQAIYLAGQQGQFSKIATGSSRIMWFE